MSYLDPEILSSPDFVKELAAAEEMQRLKQVGMDCGLEYTRLGLYARPLPPYSRFDHSLKTALLMWRFTHSLAQTAAALFHDISTPVFAHVIDFLNNDHLNQESTEADTSRIIASSEPIQAWLKKTGLQTSDVDNYHDYPIADNDSPRLSADRLEYSFSNFERFQQLSSSQIRPLLEDLVIGQNEDGEEELMFCNVDAAVFFTLKTLVNSRVYTADEDRLAMQTLAELLRRALERGLLSRAELETTEPQIIARLKADPQSWMEWEGYTGLHRLIRSVKKPENTVGWMQVPAKRRYINPFVLGKGRISMISEAVKDEIQHFLSQDFKVWLKAVD